MFDQIITLYRVVDTRYPHVSSLVQLAQTIPMFMCRNKHEWFPSYFCDEEKSHFKTFEFQVKYKKPKVYKDEKIKYTDYFKLTAIAPINKIRSVAIKHFGQQEADNLIPNNEDKVIEIFSDFGAELISQGHDIFFLDDPLTTSGQVDSSEVIIAFPKNMVISMKEVENFKG